MTKIGGGRSFVPEILSSFLWSRVRYPGSATAPGYLISLYS